MNKEILPDGSFYLKRAQFTDGDYFSKTFVSQIKIYPFRYSVHSSLLNFVKSPQIMKVAILVDIQYRINSAGNYVPKEAALLVIAQRDGIVARVEEWWSVFRTTEPDSKIPAPIRQTNRWLEKHHHGFSSDDGFTNPDFLRHKIQQLVNKYSAEGVQLFVKGRQKVVYIENILQELRCKNLEDFDAPKLSSFSPLYHRRCLLDHVGVCAREIVYQLYRWIDLDQKWVSLNAYMRK